MTTTIRVPNEVHLEATRLAALRGQQPGDLIAEAWREYLSKNKDHFAADLEEAARLLRNGTTEDVAAFASRNVRARAERAVQRSS